MPYAVCYEVAGIRFEIRASKEVRLPRPWNTYRSFVQKGSSRSAPDITIRLRVLLGKMPELRHAEHLFESDSWNLFRDGTEYWLAIAPNPITKRPAWAAHLAGDFLSGEILCDPVFLQDSVGSGVMFNPVLHRLDQLLTMHALAGRHGGIIHATGVVSDGQGIIFAGRSGAGKTTLAGFLARSPLVEQGSLLSDDRLIVRCDGDGFRVFGTPWAGEAQIAANESAPLKAIAFLRHAASDQLQRMSPAEAATELLPVLSVPWYDRTAVENMTAFCHELVGRVPAWRFDFMPTSNVWKLAAQIFQSCEFKA